MQMQPLLQRAFALVAGITVLTVAGLASADPPSRVDASGLYDRRDQFFAGGRERLGAGPDPTGR